METKKIEKIIKRICIIGLVISFIFIFALTLDYYDGEEEEVYCMEKYWRDFKNKCDSSSKYDFCSKILENGTLIKYYFNDKSTEGYCDNKFWNFNDCPGEKV